MPFIRGLIIILAVWVAYKVARQLYRSHQRKQLAEQQAASNSLEVTVVPCEYCGVHIPKGEATSANGHYYCSDRHRDVNS